MTSSAHPDFRHQTPEDIAAALAADAELQACWDELTPLARNEWICWTTSAKRPETRAKRLGRLQEEVAAGKKRPCCWPGCPHRRETARKWVQA